MSDVAFDTTSAQAALDAHLGVDGASVLQTWMYINRVITLPIDDERLWKFDNMELTANMAQNVGNAANTVYGGSAVVFYNANGTTKLANATTTYMKSVTSEQVQQYHGQTPIQSMIDATYGSNDIQDTAATRPAADFKVTYPRTGPAVVRIKAYGPIVDASINTVSTPVIFLPFKPQRVLTHVNQGASGNVWFGGQSQLTATLITLTELFAKSDDELAAPGQFILDATWGTVGHFKWEDFPVKIGELNQNVNRVESCKWVVESVAAGSGASDSAYTSHYFALRGRPGHFQATKEIRDITVLSTAS